jgi:cupin 2 domain-containing protein
MKTTNIYENIPKELKNELFETLISSKDIKIEKIVSQGHTSVKSGWYDQDTNEFVILLEGEATLSFEAGEDIRLQKGDYINIPAHKKHKVSYTSTDPKCIWLAIFY